MDNSCTTCGTPLKTIPAGVSKTTGNPYPAFQACPQGHKQPRVQGQQPAFRQQNPASTQSFERSLGDNSRQNSIIRQHSQTTAIMALELMYKVAPDEVTAEINQTGLIPTIKAYTDMFDADAKSTENE